MNAVLTGPRPQALRGQASSAATPRLPAGVDVAIPASAAPPLQVPTTAIVPSQSSPQYAPAWSTGEINTVPKFNQLSSQLEAVGRNGGTGAFAITHGLDLPLPVGLSATVTAGMAKIAPARYFTAGSVILQICRRSPAMKLVYGPSWANSVQPVNYLLKAIDASFTSKRCGTPT